MLRHPPSKVTLSMAEVDQLKHCLKIKPITNPHNAHSGWSANRATQSLDSRSIHPVPSFLRRGAQRSRDESLVHVSDWEQTVPQSAEIESVDSFQDSDSSESQSLPEPARLVQIVEVHPTITQVPGYDPPATLAASAEQSPISRRSCTSPALAPGHQSPPEAASRAPTSRHCEVSSDQQDPSSGRPNFASQCQVDRSDPGFGDSRIDSPITQESSVFAPEKSSKGHPIPSNLLDPHAPAFVPRVRFGFVTEGSACRQASSSPKDYSAREYLRPRTTSLRNLDFRGDRYCPPRILPRPRGPPYGRHQIEGRRVSATSVQPRTSRLRPPAMIPPAVVQDRYPVFSPSFPNESRQPIVNHTASSIREPAPRDRKVSPFCRQNPNSSFVRSKASTSSLSTPNLVLPLGRPVVLSRRSSLSWDNQKPPPSRSSRSSTASGGLSAPSRHWSDAVPEGREDRFPRLDSPLDELAHEFHWLSTNFSRMRASSDSSSHGLSGHGSSLLSGSLFYSEDDDGIDDEADDVLETPEPEPHHPTDDPCCTNKRNVKGICRETMNHVSKQVAFEVRPGLTPEISRPERDIELPVLSSLNQSPLMPSRPAVAASITKDPPSPAFVQNYHNPITPRRLPPEHHHKTAFVSNSQNYNRETPKIRVYDDKQPADLQPRTPADLARNHYRDPAGSPVASPCHSTLHSAKSSPATYSPLIPPRNPHRNTFPSTAQRPNPHEAHDRDTDLNSPGFNLRNAAAASAVARRRAARAGLVGQENRIDPTAMGAEAERVVWLSRRTNNGAASALDATPPREGRFERYLNEA